MYLDSLFNTTYKRDIHKYKKYACVADSFDKGYFFCEHYNEEDYKYVNLHTHGKFSYIAIDYDNEDVSFFDALDKFNLPHPNVIVQSKKTGHNHLIYVLDSPVYQYGSPKALDYYHYIKQGLTKLIGGDASYNNRFIYNPYNTKDYHSSIISMNKYELSTFVEYIDRTTFDRVEFEVNNSDYSEFPVGMRNSLVFDAIRKYCYSNYIKSIQDGFDLSERCIEFGSEINETICELPLHPKEIVAITRSVMTFVKRNFSEFQYDKWIEVEYSSEKQKFRGQRKGLLKREQALQYLIDNDGDIVAGVISDEFGVSLKTAYNWKTIASEISEDYLLHGVISERYSLDYTLLMHNYTSNSENDLVVEATVNGYSDISDAVHLSNLSNIQADYNDLLILHEKRTSDPEYKSNNNKFKVYPKMCLELDIWTTKRMTSMIHCLMNYIEHQESFPAYDRGGFATGLDTVLDTVDSLQKICDAPIPDITSLIVTTGVEDSLDISCIDLGHGTGLEFDLNRDIPVPSRKSTRASTRALSNPTSAMPPAPAHTVAKVETTTDEFDDALVALETLFDIENSPTTYSPETALLPPPKDDMHDMNYISTFINELWNREQPVLA